MPAIILICIGIVLGFNTNAFTKVPNSRSVKGEIVSREPVRRFRNDFNDRMSYYAYVEFYVNDRPYVVKTKYGASTFYVGDSMRVVYNEQNPNQAIIRPKMELYLSMLGFFVAGIIIGYMFIVK